VKTTWGDLTVRDAHVHFFSHRFFAALATQKGQSHQSIIDALGWEPPDADPVKFARHWIAELDRNGVASAALIGSIPGDEESVAAAVAAFPGRLYGYFMVDPVAEGSSARVERALSQGLQGICLFPAMHRYPVTDSRVTEILQTAAQHPGAVVFVHCGMLTVGVRKKLGLSSNFDFRYSNPLDLHSVACHFPQLPFVIPHFGAGYFREALMLADLCPNVYFDTSSSNSWVKYLAPEPSLREVFRRALDVAGPRRLLFGTDSSFFPRGWIHGVFDEQCKVLYELAVPDGDVALILGGNLERLLLR
jgi:predicted TIM-barrel fold metal-dependent hydrolase